MKFMVAVARVLLLCTVLLVFPAVAASQGSVTLQPTQGPVNTGVTATGMGWPANASVYAFFNQQPLNAVAETVDADGKFTLNFCVPNQLPGIYPTFFTISQFPGMYSGPIFTITPGTAGNCQPTAQCPDAYFVGVHGFGEGPDQGGHGDSPVIRETWEAFEKLANDLGKQAKYHSIWYPAPTDLTNVAPIFQDLEIGVKELDKQVREVVKTCAEQKIVLVGYSFGAWVINEWLTKGLDERNGNWTLWSLIRAVELYGDPLWYCAGHDYKNDPFIYPGLASGVPNTHNPYDNNPPGPASIYLALANRWQSRCLKGDAVCGEGYNNIPYANQLDFAASCFNTNTLCEHRKYALEPVKDQKVGYGLTARGANFLAFKAFSPVSSHPQVMYDETFREGPMVLFRLFFTNPQFEANGFGFVGTGWAEENHPFTNPSYGRPHPSQPSVEYPFNHACGTPSAYESDVAAWIDYASQGVEYESNSVLMHMTCTTPCEVVTPFFQNAPYSSFTWDDASSSPQSCSTGIAR